MSKLNHCVNGEPVSNQVMKYRQTRASDDYLPIQLYYDNYKEQWYSQINDYMDRPTFDCEFDYKLFKAVETFSEDESKRLASENNWSDLGRFNRWFFRILANWKSNVKNSSFRLKKRPPIQCPICHRFVGRIDQEHLNHYKTTSDLPNIFVWKNKIYEVCTKPKPYITTWGEYSKEKFACVSAGGVDAQKFVAHKKKEKWPWRLGDSTKGVMCPFTKAIVPEITNEYLLTIPDRYNRYAEPTPWCKFVELYSASLIQSDVYSLDHLSGRVREDGALGDYVSTNHRIRQPITLTYEMIRRGEKLPEFEYTFYIVDKAVEDKNTRIILKLVSAGYDIDDVSELLKIDKKEIRKKMRQLRECADLEQLLRI